VKIEKIIADYYFEETTYTPDRLIDRVASSREKRMKRNTFSRALPKIITILPRCTKLNIFFRSEGAPRTSQSLCFRKKKKRKQDERDKYLKKKVNNYKRVIYSSRQMSSWNQVRYK